MPSGPTDFAKWQKFANDIPSAEDDAADRANGANEEDQRSKDAYLKSVVEDELKPFCKEKKIPRRLQLCLACKEDMVDIVEELLKCDGDAEKAKQLANSRD